MIFSKLGFGQVNNMYEAPNHLKGITKPIDKATRKIIEKNYGDYITTFEIKGITTIKIGKENENNSGLIIGVDVSGNVTVLFDQGKHGYNGILGLDESPKSQEFENKKLEKGKLVIALQYGGDESEYASENGGEPKDYFDWVVIYIQSGDQLIQIFEHECA